MTPSPLSLRAFGRRVAVAFVATCVLLVALWVAAWHEVDAKVAQIRTVSFPEGLLTEGGNYLFVGSDTRAFVKNAADAEHFGSAETQTGQRSDTLMVAHIDPDGKTGVLVSFPRDLWVDIPDHGADKINAAFAFGGPQLAVRTLKRNFDIPISHYLEVDFAGFRDIVNAIGSVPVYFPAPARDKYSGLAIKKKGCHNLDGDAALAYVRSRFYEYEKHGEWLEDPLSDLGRIRRQQYFIRTLAQAAIHSILTHPLGASDLADKSVAALTRDKSLDTADLQKLVRAFKSTDPNAFPMTTLAAEPGWRDGQSVLLLDDAEAAPALARLRGAAEAGSQASVAPAAVRLTVENGSGVAHAAGSALDDLGADGFTVAAPATDADRSDYEVTEVRYAPGGEEKARLVLAYLGGAGKVVPFAAPDGVDVIVVLGRDFNHVATPVALQADHAAPIAARRPAAGPTTTVPPANPGGPMPLSGC
jgi:LCP family protein required for cell wall assembly